MSDGVLLRNVLHFTHLLRDLGVRVDPDRTRLFAEALSFISLSSRTEFYCAARSCLIYRERDLEPFDRAFESFWRAPKDGGIPLTVPARARRRSSEPDIRPPTKEPSEDRKPSQAEGEDAPILEAEVTYSQREALRRKDFSDLSEDELAAVQELIGKVVWRLGERRTRRKRAGGGRSLDHRGTFRNSLRFGGEVLIWSHRAPKWKPRPLVIIADVSGSMERYTRMLLHLIYGLAQGLEQHVEAFLFSTQLTRITRHLQNHNVELALREVSQHVPDWSGGTRIGSALRHFNFRWGRQVLSSGAIVVLISDGLDRGEIDLLGREVARLQRSCFRLMWANPLLGGPGYEPIARGMAAALPHVDDFLPARNLVTLEALAERIFAVAERRPLRRQRVIPA